MTLRRCSLAWLEHLDTSLSSLGTDERRAENPETRFQPRQPDKCAASSPQAKSDYSFPGQPAHPLKGTNAIVTLEDETLFFPAL